MFSFIKKTILSSLNKIKSGLGFNSDNIKNKETIEKILLENNFGSKITNRIVNKIDLNDQNWRNVFFNELKYILNKANFNESNLNNSIINVLVGINGSGKTTASIKLSRKNMNDGKKVLLLAADTFRAAAIEQLKTLSIKYSIDIFAKDELKDPSAVVFQGCDFGLENNYDKIIIDTAGRIHQKDSLMKELEKITRTIARKISKEKIFTFLVLDSIQGQSLLEQTIQFFSFIKIDGIIVTKMDANAGPGVIFSIIDSLSLPIVYLSQGEHAIDLVKFDKEKFLKELFGEI